MFNLLLVVILQMNKKVNVKKLKKNFVLNETVITYAAGKLRLGYPKSITPAEIPF